MKKFTILVALILCVTIGGVYATWNYQGGNVEELHRHFEVIMGGVDNSAAKGTFEKITNSLTITIDDEEGDYEADAVVGGYLEFVFTPKANASDDVREDGINLIFTLAQTDPAIQFEGQNVFILDTAAVDLFTGTKITAENAATLSAHGANLSDCIDSFYYCIDADDINGMITSNISLPTYEDYVAMQGILNATAAKIGIRIAEKQ